MFHCPERICSGVVWVSAAQGEGQIRDPNFTFLLRSQRECQICGTPTKILKFKWQYSGNVKIEILFRFSHE